LEHTVQAGWSISVGGASSSVGGSSVSVGGDSGKSNWYELQLLTSDTAHRAQVYIHLLMKTLFPFCHTSFLNTLYSPCVPYNLLLSQLHYSIRPRACRLAAACRPHLNHGVYLQHGLFPGGTAKPSQIRRPTTTTSCPAFVVVQEL